MCVSILAYMPFIVAQFYPRFYTMIPAGLSVGLGGGPLWCAKCTYLSVAAEAYSTISDIAADVLVTRFFGLFFMFYQMAQVWGNLISSAGGYIASNITCVINIYYMPHMPHNSSLKLHKSNMLVYTYIL